MLGLKWEKSCRTPASLVATCPITDGSQSLGSLIAGTMSTDEERIEWDPWEEAASQAAIQAQDTPPQLARQGEAELRPALRSVEAKEIMTQTDPPVYLRREDPRGENSFWSRDWWSSSHEWWEPGPWDDWEPRRRWSDEETRRWWASSSGGWVDCNICGGNHTSQECPELSGDGKEWVYDVSNSPKGSVYWARSAPRLRGVGETPADTIRGLRQSTLKTVPEKNQFQDMKQNTWASLAAGAGPGELQALGSHGIPSNFARKYSTDASDARGFVDDKTWGTEDSWNAQMGGVKEIRCPTWDGKDRSEWRAIRKRLNIWSPVGNVQPRHQGPVFLDALKGAAERACGHLRPERLMYPGGLLEIVAVLDEAYAAEAESTRFTTFDAGMEPAARARGESFVQCGLRIRAGIERIRQMGIPMDAQLEGYLVLKKMGLNDAERLAHTSLTGGNYHVESVMSGLKKIEGKTTDGERNSVLMATPSSTAASDGDKASASTDMQQILKVLLAEHGGSTSTAASELMTEDPEAYFPDELDTDEIEEDEAVQVLLAITTQATPPKGRTWAEARKLAALKKTDRGLKGRTDLPREQRQSLRIEKLKGRTKCAVCKEVGHWHRECSTARTGEHKDTVLFAEYVENMDIELGDIEIYYGTETIPKVTFEPDQVKQYPIARPTTPQEPGFGVGDSGCGCCMVGQETITKYADYVPKEAPRPGTSRTPPLPRSSASGTTARRTRRRRPSSRSASKTSSQDNVLRGFFGRRWCPEELPFCCPRTS